MIVVAGAGLVGVLLGLPLYQNAQFQAAPLEVAKGESIEVAGYTWTLVASGEFPHSADNEEVPDGLAVTAAIIEVRPGDDPETTGSCSAELDDRLRTGGASLDDARQLRTTSTTSRSRSPPRRACSRASRSTSR